MARGANPWGAPPVGGAHDDEQEDAGEKDLGDEAGGHGIAAGGVFAIAIGSKAAGQGKSGLPAGDYIKQARGDDAAKHLRDDVCREVPGGKAFAGAEADGNGRIEMATGDVPNGIGHGQHRQPEGEGNAKPADADLIHTGGQHRAAAAAEDQPESTDELCYSAFGERGG